MSSPRNAVRHVAWYRLREVGGLRLPVLTVVLMALAIAAATPAAVQAQTFLEQLEERLKLNPPAPAADPQAVPAEPGYLGLTGDDYGRSDGVEVLEIRPGSPAAAAGLQARDWILGTDQTDIRTMDDLGQVLRGKSAGERLTFRVRRGDRETLMTATLAAKPGPNEGELVPPPAIELPAPGNAARPQPGPAAGQPGPARPQLGIRAQTLDPNQRLRLGLAVRRGALVTAVEPNSPADQAGLEPGSVIVEANGRRVDVFDDLQRVIQNAVPGEMTELVYYDRSNRLVRARVDMYGALPLADPGRPAANGPVVREFPPERDERSRLGDLETRRPLLGRIGRLVEDLAESNRPPQDLQLPPPDEPFDPGGIYPGGVLPNDTPEVPERPGAASGRVAELEREVDLLRREMDLLRRQVELLQQRVDQLQQP